MNYKYHVPEGDMRHMTPFERIMKLKHFASFAEDEQRQAEERAEKAKSSRPRS